MKRSHLVAAILVAFVLSTNLWSQVVVNPPVTGSITGSIDWVMVGDPGNTADTTGYGAVADSFRIMKFEFQNSQYADFLNAVYNSNMGSNARGGISFTSGAASGSKYAIRTNMGDKPVNYVSWFDAARVANWLQNGQGSGSTETGAYTLVGGQTSGTAPAANPGASYFLPTEDQWYKAAYYKGSGTNAGYWDYATQSDLAPTAVTADSTGIGSAGLSSTDNSANFNSAADWNSLNGNVTTVGSNGGASAYGAFDMSGNIFEWNDRTGAAGSSRGLRGGGWYNLAFDLSSSARLTSGSYEDNGVGFRLASTVAVPEPSTYLLLLLAGAGWLLWRRRKVGL
jgi:formylglycine-generating enzyme